MTTPHNPPAEPIKLGALLFPGFEMLDYFGPLEMFASLDSSKLTIHTVAQEAGPVAASIPGLGAVGPEVIAQHGFATAPDFDLLLVPGGAGTRQEIHNPVMLDYLGRAAASASLIASVCTGSALLAKAGLLDGHRATSNKLVFALAVQQSDQVKWIESARWVEDGRFFTSSGVSAGMDMALAIIARLFGEEQAETVAGYAEYTWNRDPDNDPFAGQLNVVARKLGMLD